MTPVVSLLSRARVQSPISRASSARSVRRLFDSCQPTTAGEHVNDEGCVDPAREGPAVGDVGDPVVSLAVDDHLTGVVVDGGRIVPRAAVFVRPQFVPNDTLLVDLGCTVRDNGWVQVDPTGATTVPGVWAAGNATNPRAQVITAAGEGSAAAIAINNALVEQDIPVAVTNFRLGLPA